MLVVSTSDYLWFVDQALDAMVAIVRELGDDRASTRPDLAGANAPYAIRTSRRHIERGCHVFIEILPRDVPLGPGRRPGVRCFDTKEAGP